MKKIKLRIQETPILTKLKITRILIIFKRTECQNKLIVTRTKH